MEQNFDAILCCKYSEIQVSCDGEECKYLHVCRRWLGGDCSKRSCTLSHSLLTSHNKAIIEQSDYGDVTCDEELRRIVRRTLPMICHYHNRGRCDQGDNCRRLHICKQFILEGQCSYDKNCKRGHELVTPHNIIVFNQLGISDTRITYFSSDIIAPDTTRVAATCTCPRCGGPQQAGASDGRTYSRPDSNIVIPNEAASEHLTVHSLLHCLLVEHDGSLPMSTALLKFELPPRGFDLVAWARSQPEFRDGAPLRRFAPIRHTIMRNGRSEDMLTENVAFRVCLLYNYDRCLDSACPYLHVCFMHIAGLCTLEAAATETDSKPAAPAQPEVASKKRNRKRNKSQGDAEKKSLRCRLSHDVNLPGLSSLSFAKEELDEARVRKLIRSAHPSVCEVYNRGFAGASASASAKGAVTRQNACPFGERCNELHICNDHVLFRCPAGRACPRNHNLYLSQCMSVLQRFGLESAKATTIGKCIVPCAAFTPPSDADNGGSAAQKRNGSTSDASSNNVYVSAIRMLRSASAQRLTIRQVLQCLLERGTVISYCELLKALELPFDFPLWLYLRELTSMEEEEEGESGDAEDGEDASRISVSQLERLHLKPLLFNWHDEWIVTVAKAFGLCRAYSQFGTCRRADCVFLHICRNWVAGACDGRGCRFVHTLRDVPVFGALTFTTSWAESRKLLLVRQAQPRVCSSYAFTPECQLGNKCEELHMCNDMVAYGECRAMQLAYSYGPSPFMPVCLRNHDVFNPLCVRILGRYLLDVDNTAPQQVIERVLPACRTEPRAAMFPGPAPVPIPIPISMLSPSTGGEVYAQRRPRTQHPTPLSVVQYLAMRDGSARVGDLLETFGFQDIPAFLNWMHAQREFVDDQTDLYRYHPILARRAGIDYSERAVDSGWAGNDDLVTMHGAFRACLMYNFDSCFDKKCPYVHICMHLIAGLCDASRKIEQPVRPNCRLRHAFDERAFLALRLPPDTLTDAKKLALVRAAHPRVCEKYNYPPEDVASAGNTQSVPVSGSDCPCPRGAKCEELHVCNAFILMRCNDPANCKRNHDFRTAQCVAVFTRFGLDTAKPTTLAKCVLPASVPSAVRKRWATACASQRSNGGTTGPPLHIKRVVRYVAEHGGMVLLHQLLTAFRLPADFFLSSWLQELESREPSTIREVEQYRLRPLTINWHAQWFISVCRAFAVCQHYHSPLGCQFKTCRYVHICRDFVAGNCQSSANSSSNACERNHVLKSLPVFKYLDIDSWTDLRKIELLQAANPTVCEQYAFNGGQCSRGDTCDRAHVCNDLVLQRCATPCRNGLNHDIKNSKCTNAYLKFGIDCENADAMRNLLLPARRPAPAARPAPPQSVWNAPNSSATPVVSQQSQGIPPALLKQTNSTGSHSSHDSLSAAKNDEYFEVPTASGLNLQNAHPAQHAESLTGRASLDGPTTSSSRPSARTAVNALLSCADEEKLVHYSSSPDSNFVHSGFNEYSTALNEANSLSIFSTEASVSRKSQKAELEERSHLSTRDEHRSPLYMAAMTALPQRTATSPSSQFTSSVFSGSNNYNNYSNYLLNYRYDSSVTGSSLLSNPNSFPDIDYVPIDAAPQALPTLSGEHAARNGSLSGQRNDLLFSNDRYDRSNFPTSASPLNVRLEDNAAIIGQAFLCEAHIRGTCPKAKECEHYHYQPAATIGCPYWWFYQPPECDAAMKQRYANDLIYLNNKLYLPFEPEHNAAIERAFCDPNQRNVSLWAEQNGRYPFASAFDVEFEQDRPDERFSVTGRRKPTTLHASVSRQMKMSVIYIRTESQALFGNASSRGTRWNWYYRVQANSGGSTWRSCIDLLGENSVRELESEFLNGAPTCSYRICTPKCDKTYEFDLSSMQLFCAADGLDTVLISRPTAESSDVLSQGQSKASLFKPC